LLWCIYSMIMITSRNKWVSKDCRTKGELCGAVLTFVPSSVHLFLSIQPQSFVPWKSLISIWSDVSMYGCAIAHDFDVIVLMGWPFEQGKHKQEHWYEWYPSIQYRIIQVCLTAHGQLYDSDCYTKWKQELSYHIHLILLHKGAIIECGVYCLMYPILSYDLHHNPILVSSIILFWINYFWLT
jgi:hypothetical protein